MMNFLELVQRNGNEVQTDSRLIAKAFDKRHDNVIYAIENLDCSPEFAALNFKESYEISELANGRPVKYYHVTEKGAMLLIMGFSGSKAMNVKEAFIEAFATMREQLSLYRELCELHALRDAKFTEASECGRGLAHWAREKSRLYMMIKQREQKIQPRLCE